MDLFDKIPGYREAVATERFNRDAAFAELPEAIEGIAVGPLNWLRFVRMVLVESPFVCGGQVTPVAVATALWLLSPEYHPNAPLRRWRFLHKLRGHSYLKLCDGIESYIRDALADSPGGGESPSPSYYSALASQVDCLAHEYGWTAAEVLRLPFKQLFQLLRCIQARHGHDLFFNPSDRVRGEWLKQQNEGRN